MSTWKEEEEEEEERVLPWPSSPRAPAKGAARDAAGHWPPSTEAGAARNGCSACRGDGSGGTQCSARAERAAEIRGTGGWGNLEARAAPVPDRNWCRLARREARDGAGPGERGGKTRPTLTLGWRRRRPCSGNGRLDRPQPPAAARRERGRRVAGPRSQRCRGRGARKHMRPGSRAIGAWRGLTGTLRV
ncbi:unnamed protein product [Prorocentrum cordatum]|uniref:Uncharacterized protein n=1 Tax=Prorocentrum cordatum TaxID=2364126 RepID=A0ABN9V8H0_9DINO|nr:unnamed protein product [Polarella glacialis]